MIPLRILGSRHQTYPTHPNSSLISITDILNAPSLDLRKGWSPLHILISIFFFIFTLHLRIRYPHLHIASAYRIPHRIFLLLSEHLIYYQFISPRPTSLFTFARRPRALGNAIVRITLIMSNPASLLFIVALIASP